MHQATLFSYSNKAMPNFKMLKKNKLKRTILSKQSFIKVFLVEKLRNVHFAMLNKDFKYESKKTFCLSNGCFAQINANVCYQKHLLFMIEDYLSVN